MPRYSEEVKEQARQLRHQGLSYRAIGKQLNVPADAINRWCNPDVAKRSRERSQQWRAANPELKREIQQVHYHNNLEAERERSRAYNAANKKRIAVRMAVWQKLNKPKTRANSSNRRAMLAQATPPWLHAGHKAEIESIHAQACHLESVEGVVYHVDHIFPLKGFKQVGTKKVHFSCGLHVPWNLRPMAGRDNCSKWAWHPDNEEATAW